MTPRLTPRVTPRVLVVAKAPVPGRAKTRLGAAVGYDRAADLAAAALLDTLDACRAAFDGPRYLALDGDLGAGARADQLGSAVRDWQVFAQQGASFGDRLAHAHQYVGATPGGPVVQVGMDTPQLTPALLRDLAGRLPASGHAADAADAAVLGPAEDGGWWALVLARPGSASALAGVPMSTPTTGADTAAALRDRGAVVLDGPRLRDVDTPADAARVAADAPTTRFARAWAAAERAA